MRVIKANIQCEKGKLNRYFSSCVGAGRAMEIMRAQATEQLKTVHRECSFRYIRFHGLFHEEMGIVSRDSNKKLHFNFQYVDLLFDSLLEIGMRPIVELGLMPQELASENKYVFWWKMNISMPKDIDEWSSLIEALIIHLTKRYGKEEIRQWYFEVWNEPNHSAFFSEYKDKEAYFKLYDIAALTIKKLDPCYRVGGPATAGMCWITDFIEHCREKSIPLDFISSHSYGVKGDFDSDGNATLVLCPIDSLSDTILFFGELCHKEGLPLLITEWSSSYSPSDPIHDTYFNAPFILRTIKRCDGYADMLSYWTYTDIFEEQGPPIKPFHGGFGLLNIQSLPKPTFYAYSFLARLSDTELKCDDENAYICKSENSIQILFWNIAQPKHNNNNRVYFAQEMPSKKLENAEIEISGLKCSENYSVFVETVGYKSGDVYSAYLNKNFDDIPTREDIKQLAECAKPRKTPFTVLSDECGVLKFKLPQTENQVDFVEIYEM